MATKEIILNLTDKQITMLLGIVGKRGTELMKLKKEAKLLLNDSELNDYIDEELDVCISVYSSLASIK